MILLLCGLGSLVLGTLIGSVWKIKKGILRELLLIFANILFVGAVYHFVNKAVTMMATFIVAFIASVAIGIFITLKQAKKHEQARPRGTVVSLLTGSIKTYIVYYISSILAFGWYNWYN